MAKNKNVMKMVYTPGPQILIPFIFSENNSSIQLLVYPKRKESGVMLKRNRDQFTQFLAWKAQHLLKWLNSFDGPRKGNDICIKFSIVNRSIETDNPRNQWIQSLDKLPKELAVWMREVEFALSDYGRMRIDGDIEFEITFQGEQK